ALSDRHRRMRPMEEGEAGTIADPLVTRPRTHWLEPVPDARALPSDANPFERAALRQSIRLAFVAALQHLPPRQRAALLLTEVLGLSAAETAECLDTSVAGVNSALQRARATLASRKLPADDGALSETQANLLDRYMDAFARYDIDALVALMREDATLSMPPYTLWLRGPEAIRGWLLGPGAECRGSRLVRVEASGSPAFAQYRCDRENGGYKAWSLTVLELSGDRVAAWNAFLDTDRLFPLFDLPLRLPATSAAVR